MKGKLENVGISLIVPSKDNARKIDQGAQEFKDLVESIRAGGVRVPVQLKILEEGKKYEIRAGERRWRAAKAAGLAAIPAIIYSGMDELDAFDLTFIENKFRKDLKPLEEVKEIGKFIDKVGDEVRLIASKIGKSEKWVRLRANVHKNLVPQWRKAFEKMPELSGWGVNHLVLIARLPKNIQNVLFNDFKDDYNLEDITAAELDNRISQKFNLLSGAKWELDDETLVPKAGSCEKCPKRTGHQPLLWFDLVSDQVKKMDRCLDGFCWNAKVIAYLHRRAKQLSVEHEELVFVFNDYPGWGISEELEEEFGRCLSKHNYTKRAKSNKKSVPALVVYGDNTGDLIWIEEHRTGGRQQSRSTGKPTPLKVRRQRLEAKRTAQVLKELQEAVNNATYDDITYADKNTGLMAAVAFLGNVRLFDPQRDDQKRINRLVREGNVRQAAEYLWESFKPTLNDELIYNGPVTQTPGHYDKDAEWIAKLIGADLKAIKDRVAKMKGFTEPGSWKNLNADGTPKVKNERARKTEKSTGSSGAKAKDK